MLVAAKPNPRQNPSPQAPPPPATQLPNLPAPAPTPRDAMPIAPGLEPASTNGPQFVQGRVAVVGAAANNVIECPVDYQLRYRKIYAYLFTTASTATDYLVQCQIQFWRNGSMVGWLPLHDQVSPAGGGVSGNEDWVTIFVSGGLVFPDSIGLNLGTPAGAQAAANIVQPQCVYSGADKITVSVIKLINVTSVRLWLGVLSCADK